MRINIWMIILMAGISLTGCKGSEKTPEQETSASPAVEESTSASSENVGSLAGNWVLYSILEGGKEVELPYEKWKVQLTFPEEEQGTVRIKSPCNSGGCGFNARGGTIQFQANCYFTEMYCEEEQRNLWQNKLVSYLQQCASYTLSADGSKLQLQGLDKQLKFKADE